MAGFYGEPMKKGTLYGIGVGPGDPDLITLKAVKTLRKVDVIYTAASTKNTYSIAVDIVKPHLNGHDPIIRLDFPMTRESEVLTKAWSKNAEIILCTLSKGRDAALLTLGDPMTYSTFGYILRTIKEADPNIAVQVIPGITSYQAGSASAGRVLAEGEESFTVISGALGAEKLKRVIHHTDNVVVLKVYRNYKEIMDTLQDLDLTSRSVLVSRCGFEGEAIYHNLDELPDTTPPYLSLIIIKKKV
jgi:precorrin-2/cobalt-factor-2 C20-methyltransferase